MFSDVVLCWNATHAKLRGNRKNKRIAQMQTLWRSVFLHKSLMALCHHDPRLMGAWASPGPAVEQLFSNSLCFPWPCQDQPLSWAPHATAWGKCLLVQGSLQKLLQLRSAPWHLGVSSGTLLCHKLGFSGSSGPWGLAGSMLLSSFYPSGFY